MLFADQGGGFFTPQFDEFDTHIRRNMRTLFAQMDIGKGLTRLMQEFQFEGTTHGGPGSTAGCQVLLFMGVVRSGETNR